jgi:endonuclease/exonuclease/phosphatase family metal-dependent hydrolase
MKKLLFTLSVAFAIIFAGLTPAQAQLFENFEGGAKTGYANGTVTLNSGTWFFNDALLGTLANDKKEGGQSVRLRNGSFGMNFNVSGAGELSFLYAYFGSDGNSQLQVQYSLNNGTNWENLGDPITPTSTLQEAEFDVQIAENIRFRFLRVNSTSTTADRINVDNVRITQFVVAEDEATIDLFVDDVKIENEGTTEFPATLVGTERTKTLEIKNRGNEALTITSVSVSGDGYSISEFNETTLEFNEGTELTLTFAPQNNGIADGTVEISSNAENHPLFTLNLLADAFEDGDVIPIAEARELPFGTRVTVAGRVTVANEFEGPVFLQDQSAGIAVFYAPLHTAVQIGDFVTVTGPLTEFNPINGAPGTFLRQIAAVDGDDNILFEVSDLEPLEVIPSTITAAQMNAGGFESLLVIIKDAAINHQGAFQANINYNFTDQSGATAVMRIDNSTDLVGATAPDGLVNMIGVVDRFNGVYQLKPRFTQDLGVEPFVYPGDNIPKNLTLDVVTWNIEWFGAAGNGPDDNELQLTNVKTLITTIDADIYALQEIANPAQFVRLVNELEDYRGFTADFSQSQKTAYLFKSATIDSLSSGLIGTESGMVTSDWANGRFPLMFHFNANIEGHEREIFAFNIHAKAFADQPSYNQRVNASSQMKAYLDNIHQSDRVIFLGDYNDDVTTSTFDNLESPYQNFVDDPNYKVITKSLSERGFTSYTSISMIDHITINSNLFEEYFEGTERVENPSYIGSYLSTTSDHFPVWTRFLFDTSVSTDDDFYTTPSTVSLNQNYPNPFNPSTIISYQLPNNTNVRLDVYDVMGRRVATLVNGIQPAGEYNINFDASNLASGVYIYRITMGNGQHLSRKMLLVK